MFRSDRKEGRVGGEGGGEEAGQLAGRPAVQRRSLMDGRGEDIKNTCEPMKAAGELPANTSHGGCHARLRLIKAPPPPHRPPLAATLGNSRPPTTSVAPDMRPPSHYKVPAGARQDVSPRGRLVETFFYQ